MKKMPLTGLRLCLLLFTLIAAAGARAQVVRCYTVEHDSILHSQYPQRETVEEFEDWIAGAIEESKHSKIIGGVYQIPVVFHVIHRSTHAIGTGTNVSYAAIQSQVDVLNEDFRRILGTNGYNTHPDGADTEIEFCLAQRRPDGTAFPNSEPGVNRVNANTQGWGNGPFDDVFCDGTIKPFTNAQGYDPAKYMNIWLVDLGSGLLGYAQFPTSPLGGMFDCASGGPTATDGVVLLYSSIGKSSVTGYPAPYNEGRTATHEIGHWLGLRHIWGDGGCTVDDFCSDTPEAAAANSGCPVINTCTAAPDAGNDMVENYMDYTYDACMNIFTNDQKQRMRTVLENSPIRASLINSDACTPPTTVDASVTDIFAPTGDQCVGSITPSVQLRNRGANTLTSATITYRVDNGTPTTFSWTGTLAAGASATVALPAFTSTLGVHEFKAYSTLPNGIADPSPLYDTSSISFVVSNGIMPDFSENFEAPLFPPDIRWTVNNVNGDCFEWVGASATSSAGVFNNNAAQMPFFNNSSTSNENLITPAFIVPCNATVATLTFDVSYRQRNASSNDRLIVEISTDCGSTWTATGYDKAGTVLRTVTTTQNSYFTPTAAAQWRNETINLLSFVSATSDNVRFRFRAIGSGGANGNNIYVDNIVFNVTTPGEIDLTAAGNEVLDGGAYNFGNVVSGGSQTATFTITNTGSTDLTLTPPITITGTGFALGTTFGATTIAAGGTTTFTLTFAPTGAGPFTGNVSFATNDCDEGTYNFVLSGTGIALPPVADFTATPTTVCAGATVTFTNLSTYATSYSWNFGAAATPPTSTAANPSVVFNTPGTYPVTLTATNAFGSDVETKAGFIVVLNSAGAALPLTQGFTAATFPPTGWSIVNNNASPTTWVRSGTIGVAPSAGNSMMFDNYSYNDADDDEVRLAAVTLTGMISSQLTFDVAYAPYDAANFDGLQVLVSTNCGVTFTSVYSKSNTTLATAAAVTSAFTPTAAQWRTETVNLTPYVGQSSVIVAFRNLSGYGNRLFVDNINITGVAGTPPPVASFTASPTTVCAGQSVTFTNTSTNSPTSNSWTFAGGTPGTSASASPTITYNTPGTYNVSLTATNAGGSDSEIQNNYITVVAAVPMPTISAGGPTTFCAGGSVTLTSSSATGNTWSNGATTQSITVSTAGTYTVTVSNGTCSATSAGTTVTVNPLPATPTISAGGPTTFCTGGSVTLTSSSATGNTWSNGATTQSITVSASGTYTVTVSNGTCTATSAGTTVTVNPLPATPTISAGGPTTFCAGGSVTLTSSSATGNTWSNGATTQSITVSASGTYTVTVSNGTCTSATSAGTTVTVNPLPATPTISAGGSTTFCAGGSVTLTSSSATGNTWSNGATTQSITVSTAGTYTVTVSNGTCTATSAGTTVTVNPLPATPTISAGGPTTFCAGGSVTLTSSSATGNTWSNGATTQSIAVSTAGTYTVTVSNGTCTATSAGTTVTVNPLPATPTISAGGSTTFCTGGSVTLTSSSATGNTWSNGATTQSITVSASGTYTVTVSNGTCTATSAGTTVTVNPLPATPTISAGGSTTFCTGGSVTLTSSSATGNTWLNGATTQSITVSASGTYTVTVSNGTCTVTSAGTTVTVNPLPATPTISAGGPTTFCAGGSVTLTSSSATGNTWSNGATTQSITVSAAGTYTVTVSNGTCTATSAGTTVTVNPLPATPTISAGGPTTFCAGGSVTLTSSSATGNTWSNGATTQSITVSTAGTYTVTVSNGTCTATSAGTTVTVNPLPATPTISAGGPTTFCAGGSVTLTSSSATGNTWSNGATTQSITVSTAGTYTVTVSDGTCSSATSAGTTITVNTTPTIAVGTITNPTTCGTATGSIQITGTGTGNVSWTGTASGAMTGVTLPATITGLAAGSYTITFSNASGCVSNSVSQGLNDPSAPPTPTISASGPLTFCEGGSVTLTSSSASGNTWSNGETTQAITVTSSGSYAVTFTNGSGCSATSVATIVTVNTNPVISIGTVTDPTACGTPTGSIAINGSGTGDLSWTGTASGTLTGVTLPATVPNLAAGSYNFTFENASGCMSNAVSQGLNDPSAPPTPTISTVDPTTFCEGGMAVLTSSSATGNTWSNGETTQSIVVTTAGNYAVTVTNGGGCSATSAATAITVLQPPTATLGAIADLCVYALPITLTQGSPAGGTYGGNGVGGGQFDPAGAGLGTSTVEYYYTDGNGCSDTAATTVFVDDCASLEEAQANAVQVFPNPSSGQFTIDAGTAIVSEVRVFDHAGRLVQIFNGLHTTNTSVDLTSMANGVYTLQILTDHATRRIPVVVNR